MHDKQVHYDVKLCIFYEESSKKEKVNTSLTFLRKKIL